MPIDELGTVDFQLYLLKTMDPPGPLLESALEQMGRTTGDMLARYEVVSRATKPRFGSARRIRSILSEVMMDGSSQEDYRLNELNRAGSWFRGIRVPCGWWRGGRVGVG